MANHISDETIEYVGGFWQSLSCPARKRTGKEGHGDKYRLDDVDKLNELDTDGVEPMSHVFPVNNVFREDIVTNGDDREGILKNAPEKKKVPLCGAKDLCRIGGSHGNFRFDSP